MTKMCKTCRYFVDAPDMSGVMSRTATGMKQCIRSQLRGAVSGDTTAARTVVLHSGTDVCSMWEPVTREDGSLFCTVCCYKDNDGTPCGCCGRTTSPERRGELTLDQWLASSAGMAIRQVH